MNANAPRASRGPSPLRVLGWVLMISVGSLVAGAAPAEAHATIDSTTPVDGAHLSEGPGRLVFRLDEPVTLVSGSAQLIDGTGKRYPFSATRQEDGGRAVVLVPQGEVPDGAYLATARVISADTHVVSLSIQFTVGTVTQPRLIAGPRSDDELGSFLGDSSKAVVYLGLILSAGVFLAGRWAWPRLLDGPRYRVVYRIGGSALIVGFAVRVAALGAERSGSLGTISWRDVTQVIGTLSGTAIAIAVGLSLLTVAFVPGEPTWSAVGGVVQAAAAVTAVTLGGHGGSTVRWPWSFVETFLHVYAVTVWLGGVAVLAVVLRRGAPVQRWHRVAGGHLALVVSAGLLLALAQVSPPAALLTTTYGRVLVAKVAVVAAVVGLGLVSYRRYRRVGGVGERGSAPAMGVHGRPVTVLAETGLAVVVLAITSVLSSVAPAKDTYTTTVDATLDFGDAQVVHVRVNTVRRGAQTFTVRYAAGDARAAADPDIRIDLASVQADVARLPVQVSAPARTGKELTWTSTGLIVPAHGRWQVTVRFDGSQGPRLASFFYEVL